MKFHLKFMRNIANQNFQYLVHMLSDLSLSLREIPRTSCYLSTCCVNFVPYMGILKSNQK